VRNTGKQTKQTFTTSKHTTEFTYSDFPCHFKVNRDKLALTNRRWTCKIKEGKSLTITVNFYERNLGSMEKIWPMSHIVKSWTGRAHDLPFKFEDLGFRPAQMLEKKWYILYIGLMVSIQERSTYPNILKGTFTCNIIKQQEC